MCSCDINTRVSSQNDKRFRQEPGDGLVIRLLSMAAGKGLRSPQSPIYSSFVCLLFVLL